MRDSAAARWDRARSRVIEKFSLDAEANGIASVYRTLI
jgi:mannosyltransferase